MTLTADYGVYIEAHHDLWYTTSSVRREAWRLAAVRPPHAYTAKHNMSMEVVRSIRTPRRTGRCLGIIVEKHRRRVPPRPGSYPLRAARPDHRGQLRRPGGRLAVQDGQPRSSAGISVPLHAAHGRRHPVLDESDASCPASSNRICSKPRARASRRTPEGLPWPDFLRAAPGCKTTLLGYPHSWVLCTTGSLFNIPESRVQLQRNQ